MPPFKAKPPLIIIGPSASGKSTVAGILVSAGAISVIPTWTTRPRRNGEVSGYVDHHFVSEAAFRKMEQSGGFIRTAQLFGLQYRYGLPQIPTADTTPAVPAIILRSLLSGDISRLFKESLVYQIEASFEKVSSRLGYRDGKSNLGSRATGYWVELEEGRKIADRIFINDRTPEELASTMADSIRKDFLQLCFSGV